MRRNFIQIAGIAWTLLYAAFIIWIYATEPRTLMDLTTQASVVAGTYTVDEARLDAARELFRREQYRAAREEWQRADPGQRDARTQFYIAYAYYREGWGRIYNDATLFQQGLDAVNRALALAPGNALTVDDPDLKIHSAAELKAELETGLERNWGDFNPLKVLRQRK